MTTDDSNGAATRGGWLKRLAPLLVLAAVAALVVWQGWHRHLSLQTIADNRDALKALIAGNYPASLLGYIAVYMGTVALSLPGAVYLTVAGGFLFGWLIGGTAAVAGATVGATAIFLIARTSLGEPLAARAGPRLAKLREGFQENAMSYLLFLRLVPVFPFWLVNLAPALLGVPLATYVAGTVIGIIPGAFAFAFAGAGLDSVIVAQKQAYLDCVAAHAGKPMMCVFKLDPSALVTKKLLIAFAALGVLALLPVVVKKFRRRAPAARARF